MNPRVLEYRKMQEEAAKMAAALQPTYSTVNGKTEASAPTGQAVTAQTAQSSSTGGNGNGYLSTISNYLTQQANAMQQATPAQPTAAIPSAQSYSSYNPFDSGISKAIESAQASLGMNREQKDRALRSSILRFGEAIGQVPRQRGFRKNLLTGLKALGKGVSAYDESEATAEQQNNDYANQILKYRAQEQARQAQEQEMLWNRQYQQDQLAEQRRYHDMSNEWHEEGNASKGHGKASPEALKQLSDTFDYASQQLNKYGDKGSRSRATRIINEYLPGGGRELTPSQASISTLDKILRGKLFNMWGYRATKEFEELPHISVDNSPATNRAVLNEIQNTTRIQMGLPPIDYHMKQQISAPQNSGNAQNVQLVRMRTPDGEIRHVNPRDLQKALDDKLEVI